MRKKGVLVNWAGFLVMVSQQPNGKRGKKLTWHQAWGGSFLTSFLLGVPAPQLLSPLPLINYLSVHILLSTLVPTTSLPPPHLLDPLVILFDALMRTFPISGAVLSAVGHTNPAIRSSTMMQMILGGLSTSGGGLVASTLNVFSPDWSLSTPPMLFAGWTAYFDFVAGAIGAAVFGLVTASTPFWADVSQQLNSSIFLGGSADVGSKGVASATMTPLGARSLVCFVLCVLYAGRALAMHGNPFTQSAALPPVKAQKAAEKKRQ